MNEMPAAVVTSFDEPPHYQQFPIPRPTSEGELLVEVLAVERLAKCTRKKINYDSGDGESVPACARAVPEFIAVSPSQDVACLRR